jgi:hypothetical protein
MDSTFIPARRVQVPSLLKAIHTLQSYCKTFNIPFDSQKDSLHSLCIRIVSVRSRSQSRSSSLAKSAILYEWFQIWPVRQHVYDRICERLPPTSVLYKYHRDLRRACVQLKRNRSFPSLRRFPTSIAALECLLIMYQMARPATTILSIRRLAQFHSEYMHPLLSRSISGCGEAAIV